MHFTSTWRLCYHVTLVLLSVMFATGATPAISETAAEIVERGFSTGNAEESITLYSLAIELNPSNEYAYLYRATALFTLGSVEGALADLDRALVICPAFSEAYHVRARIRKSMGDLLGSEADMKAKREAQADGDHNLVHFDAAMKAAPGNPTNYLNRARYWTRGKTEYQKSADDYEEFVRLGGVLNESIALRMLDAQRLSGDTAGAVTTATKAIELSSYYNIRLFEIRAKLREELGDVKGSASDKARVQEVVDDQQNVMLSGLDEALEERPGNSDLLIERAEKLVEAKRYDAAYDDIQAVLEKKDHNSSRATWLAQHLGGQWRRQAKALLEAGDASGALLTIDRALGLLDNKSKAEKLRQRILDEQKTTRADAPSSGLPRAID